MSMTKALVVMVSVLSFGYAGAAFAAGAASKSGGTQAASKSTSSQSSPAASKGAAKGALNANGPSLDGLDGQVVVFSKADRVVLQSGR
jgi:hypothetical protein